MGTKAYKHCSSTNNLNLSFKDSRGFLSRLGYWEDSVSLILDWGGVAFKGDLPAPAWGDDPMHQVDCAGGGYEP